MSNKPVVKRAWPLVIKTFGSHVLHISDANSPNHCCGALTRCGRDINNAHSIGNIQPEEFDIDDPTLVNGWKKEFRFMKLKKEPVLCARCGTKDDFKQAQAEYLRLFAEQEAERERLRARQSEILMGLIQRTSDIMDGLVENQLSDFPCACEEDKLFFWVGDFKFEVSPVNIDELAKQELK